MRSLEGLIIISALVRLSAHSTGAIRTNNCECGQRNAASRVVGGRETLPYEYPWIVFLVIYESAGSNSFINCDATIINDRVLLTAAHCASSLQGDSSRRIATDPRQISAVFQIWNRDVKDDLKSIVRTVEKVIVHPGYINLAGVGDKDYNIALLILSEKIDIITQPYFNPICLPKRKEMIVSENRNATIAGWGLIIRADEATKTPPQKTSKPHLNVFLHSEEMCRKYLPSLQSNFYTLFICSGYVDERGAAPGDSGAPLFLDLPSGENVQIGIVSHGITSTGTKNYTLTMYTRITYFQDWIEHHSKQVLAKWCPRKKAVLEEHSPFVHRRKVRIGPPLPLPRATPPPPALYAVEPPQVEIEPYEPPQYLDTCTCGTTRTKAKRQASPRIVGGIKTGPFEFPWLVHIDIHDHPRNSNITSSSCTGSLINDRIVLTAAHCVISKITRQLRSPNQMKPMPHIYDTRETRGVYFASVKQILLYPNNSIVMEWGKYKYGDIALLVLREPLHIVGDPNFSPICLPRKNEIIKTEDTEATVSGWGILNRENNPAKYELTNYPMKIDIPLHEEKLCRASTPADQTPLPINAFKFFICGDYLDMTGSNAGDGAAKGDYGGPLFINLPSNDKTQIGVVSHGVVSRDKSKLPRVTMYSRITNYLPWIEMHSAKVHARWCDRS